MKKNQFIILLVIGIVMGVIFFGPILRDFQLKSKINQESKKTVSLLEKKLNTLEGIDRVLVNDRVLRMESVFPSKKPVVPLLSTLSQLSRKHGLGFGGVTLQPGILTEQDKGKKATGKLNISGLYEIKFGFEVSGNFTGILQFMKELEKVAPLMRIDKVGLKIKTNPLFDDQQTLVAAKIDVSSFYKAAPTTIGPITQPVVLLSSSDEAILANLFAFTQFPVILPVAQTGKVDLFGAGL